MSAGKGDKLRQGADLKKFWENYDRVFAKKKTVFEWQKQFNDVIIDYDGFREYNADDVMTEQQYKQLLQQCTTKTQTKS